MSGDPIAFGLLGPFEVNVAGAVVDLGGPRQQTVLATLALTPNRAVSIDRLIAAVYGDDPPSTARVQVQISVSALRRLLAAYGHPDMIATRPAGYLLQVDDGLVDLRRYEVLVAQGRACRDGRRWEAALDAYRSALALWRGPALGGLNGAFIRAAAHRLDEERISVTEDRMDLELDLGRHRDVLDELAALANEHPLRERLQGQLMLALYRAGRQADALEVYRRARRTLVDELGLEPNIRLQRLERAILSGDAALDPAPVEMRGPESSGVGPPWIAAGGARAPGAAIGAAPPVGAPPVPRLLPTDIADFTGRAAELRAVEAGLDAPITDRSAVPVVAVNGRPGIGKTTLAVHVAHRLADRYPGGQLFADLRGPAGRRAEPAEILGRFLRVLGVPGSRLPDSVDARAELYRHLLADRRVLVVLDNAGDEGQVLPLLPGAPPSAVLITGRHRLGGLPGAVHVEIDLFEPPTAVELLGQVAGADRVHAEPAAAAALAGLCDHLPLALRIAGARLIARPHWTVEHLAARLSDQERRLEELQHGPLGVRASLALSYEELSDDARRLFRRLALVDFPHISGWVAAALLGCAYARANDLLDDLADVRLLDPEGVGRRYRCHDLVRVYARERLLVEDPADDRAAALGRALGALLFLAERARGQLEVGDVDFSASDTPRWPLPDDVTAGLLAAPMAWLDSERHTLTAGVRQAAEARLADLSCELAYAASTVFEARAHFDDWRLSHEIALAAAEEAGDLRGRAMMHYSLGSVHLRQHRFDDARRHLDRAVALFRQAGEEQALSLPLRNLAYLDRLRGHFDEAIRRYEEALAPLRRGGYPVPAAYILHSLAHIQLQRGDTDAALRMLGEALELSQHGTTRQVEAQVRYRMGETWLHLAEPERAAEAFAASLRVVEDDGDPIGRAYVLGGLGLARLRSGALADAAETLNEALRLATAARDRMAEGRSLLGLAELALADSEPRRARVQLHRALELFRVINVPPHEARALALLARADTMARLPADNEPNTDR